MANYEVDNDSVYERDVMDDAHYNRILAAYHRQQLVETLTGPAISMASHIVLLALVAVFFLTRVDTPVEPDLTAVVKIIPLPEIDPPDVDIDIPEDPQDPDDVKVVSDVQAPQTDPGEVTSTETVNDLEPTTDDHRDFDEVLTTTPILSSLTYVDPRIGGRTPGGQKEAIGIVGHGPHTRRGQDAVLRALRWLKRVQNANGSWGVGTQWSDESGHAAHTGLALLTFLAHGDTPLSEEFGVTVQNAMRWLSNYANQSDLDRIVKKKHGAYTHGIATYALCEAYAMTKIPFLQTGMENALTLIVSGQMPNGGFGYAYTSGPRWDMSVAGWNIQALKAGRMAGSTHPQLAQAIEKSVRFCRQAAYSGKGGYGYAQNRKGASSNMGGVGVVALQLLGHTDSAQAVDGANRIAEKRYPEYNSVAVDPSKWNAVAGKSLYGWYYDTQAMYNTYKTNKKRWKDWQRTFEKVLVGSQNTEGYWETNGQHQIGTADTPGRVLATCLSTLQLEVYYRYLATGSGAEAYAAEDKIDTTVGEGGIVIDILD